jgi:hypothetical protein
MSFNDKKKSGLDASDFQDTVFASRARNRTVMLTPEVTDQVRALLQTPENIRPQVEEDNDEGSNSYSTLETTSPATGYNYNPTLVFDKRPQTFESDFTPVKDFSGFKDESITTPQPRNTRESGKISTQAATQPVKEDQSGTRTNLKTQGKDVTQTYFNNYQAERGGTLSTTRDSRPELHKPMISEAVFHPSKTKAHATFNEERNVLAKETAKRHHSTSRIIGFLVSFDESEGGEVHELRVGRWLVSSNNVNQKDTIIVEDDSISPLHAVVKVFDKGDVQILDQLSESGTGVLKQGSMNEEDASDGVILITHGDVVRFGKRYYVYCAVPRIQIHD